MTVSVVGLGYIGLPTALLLARTRDVVGVDIDEDVVATLNDGGLPFEEPGLAELFAEVAENFSAQTTVPEDAEAYLVATPTPLDEVTEVANLRYVGAAAESVAAKLDPGDLVVLESTVPPGTSERLVLPILDRDGPDEGGVRYAHCPERASPGATLDEMVHNDRLVGGVDTESRERTVDLYDFAEGAIHPTDPTTAEFVKLMENTYRDVNIALANEFAMLGEEYAVDTRHAIELANEHPRVDVHSPGPGVGGHCLPIDPQFLTQSTTDSRLISVARDINESMAVHTLRHVRRLVDTVAHAQVTVLGVAYKGNVDDTRETPALRLLRLAENEGFDVRASDPRVDDKDFTYPLSDLDAAVADSDCLVVVTDHAEFTDLDPSRLAAQMRQPAVVDTRGILDPERWRNAGFTLSRLGDGRHIGGDRSGEMRQ
ncbi:UDP-N-acetyl-D-mannosaminuronic acid dehydrogenase [Halogranum amylolyticum]|uniref:UDP-N-acetyl-D-mannosamine dehydrogenase n=1 Tax=Halogranum amylolyticum TaxID=660520 RepID=A0A1H8WND6_9EURY|nr:nucleotide sugar dehydrogenase [Halogranum amylolyticum]SEP29132.1 UDP-N-acetyl-D-mannosaminuronic acid dehydrogenase [Halogranum amylolyticum]